MKTRISFERNADGVRDAAIFMAQLVREGVTFDVQTDNVSIDIILTGGF